MIPAMARIDPELERKRLIEFYSQQMDGELEEVAAQAYDLTDLAREALRTEMARRSLGAAFVEQAPVAPVPSARPGDPPPELPRAVPLPGGEFELQDMVTIRKFRDLPEALFAKGSLESAGIECAMLDDNMVRLDWFISNLLGGVKLQVRQEDASIAEEILSQRVVHVTTALVHQRGEQEIPAVLNRRHRNEDDPGHHSGFATLGCDLL